MQSRGRPDVASSRDAFAAVESALERSHLAQAEELLSGLEDPAAPHALVLSGKLHLLRDDAPATIRILSNQHFADRRLQMQRALLLGAAHSRVGDFDAADEYFDAAEEIAKHDPETLAEIAYRRGRRYGYAGDVDRARRQLAAASQAESAASKLHAMQLEGFIYGLERRYAEQAGVLARMLEQIDPDDERYAMEAAFATFTLAVLGRELHLPHVIPIVERQLQACKWPAELNVPRFQALKALGWTYALHGDYFTAFRYLKKSMAYAPSPAWQAISALDRAYLARCLNEERWSCQELSEAEDLAEAVDWRSTRNEERVALLLLAELSAATDAGRAAEYMAMFRDLGDFHGPQLQVFHDDRLQAQAGYSAGVVQLALGNAMSGAKLMRESFAVYDAIGYDWSAGRCALRLFEATGEEQFLRIAGEKLRYYPKSWLADDLRRHTSGKHAQPVLPPMQQRVFEELCKGLSTAQIAANLGRSEYTIKNHIKLIFKAFGVKSRAALIAQVVKHKE